LSQVPFLAPQAGEVANCPSFLARLPPNSTTVGGSQGSHWDTIARGRKSRGKAINAADGGSAVLPLINYESAQCGLHGVYSDRPHDAML
jgi:hypothetical protein